MVQVSWISSVTTGIAKAYNDCMPQAGKEFFGKVYSNSPVSSETVAQLVTVLIGARFVWKSAFPGYVQKPDVNIDSTWSREFSTALGNADKPSAFSTGASSNNGSGGSGASAADDQSSLSRLWDQHRDKIEIDMVQTNERALGKVARFASFVIGTALITAGAASFARDMNSLVSSN